MQTALIIESYLVYTEREYQEAQYCDSSSQHNTGPSHTARHVAAMLAPGVSGYLPVTQIIVPVSVIFT